MAEKTPIDPKTLAGSEASQDDHKGSQEPSKSPVAQSLHKLADSPKADYAEPAPEKKPEAKDAKDEHPAWHKEDYPDFKDPHPKDFAAITLAQEHGFFDEHNRYRHWEAGDVITNRPEIEELVSRGAPVLGHEHVGGPGHKVTYRKDLVRKRKVPQGRAG